MTLTPRLACLLSLLAAVSCAALAVWLLWDWPRYTGLVVPLLPFGVTLLVWGYVWDWLHALTPEGRRNEH